MDAHGFGPAGPGERGLAIRGRGPLLASTCQEITPWIVWDVNGYYRELGFALGERPTKIQLRQAYTRLNGPNDVRLTAILHLLLRQRAEYDRQPFADLYMDSLTTLMLRRAAKLQADRDGRLQQDVLDDWGLHDLPEDFEELEREFLASQPSAPHRSRATVLWSWSWYADCTECDDIPRLAYWQQLLVPHLPIDRFAVGLSRYGDPVSARMIGGEWAIFLRDDQMPDEGLARQAAQWTDRTTMDSHAQLSAIDVLQHNSRRAMKYQSGPAAAKTVQDETSFSSSRKYAYLSSCLKKDGDSVILRFLDDAEDLDNDERNFWITLATHDFVPVKKSVSDGKDGNKGPKTMMAVCRTQGLLGGEHEDCYICANIRKPDRKGTMRPWNKSGTTFARAVHREKFKVTEAEVAAGTAPPEILGRWAMRDKMIDVDELDQDGNATGKKVTRPEIFLVHQKWSNFFSPTSIMAQEYNGTVLDRDFKYTRTGEGTDTDYTPAPLNQTPDFDMSNPDTRAVYDAVFSWEDLLEFVDNLHSDEYYGKFFDPSYIDPDDDADETPSKAAKTTRTAKASSVSVVDEDDEPEAPANGGNPKGVTAAQMQAMKDRVMKGKQKSDETDDEPVNA